MKKLLLIVLILATTAPEQVRAQQTDEDEAALGKIYAQYATLAGGWYIETRCNYLADNLLQEFEWNLAQINEWAAALNNPSFFKQLRASALETVDAKYPDCDDTTYDIVIETYMTSKSLTKRLTGRAYIPGVSYAAYNLRRFSQVAFAVEFVMTVCDQKIPADIQADITRVYEAVSTHLSGQYPEAMDALLESVRDKGSAFEQSRCGADTGRFVNASLAELRYLEKSLGLGE